MAVKFNAEHMYTFIKGFAMGKDFPDTTAALSFAREAHKDQQRKDGQPYLVHPLTVACHAIALGLAEDTIIASCLLHDVVEDCGIKVEELPVSDQTREAVRRLTHVKGEPLEPYYREIGEHRVAALCKLLDRCDNVSTMAGVFSLQKTYDYIQETRDYVLPLLRSTKDQWPNDSNALFVLKYHIGAVIDGLEQCLEAVAADYEDFDGPVTRVSLHGSYSDDE